MVANLQSLIGVILIPAIAYALCDDRRALPPALAVKTAAVAIALQALIAALFLLAPGMTGVFALIARAVAALQAATNEGVKFAFGFLAGGPAPYDVTQPQNGFVLALQALPLILLVSVLSRLLFHWGILQRIIAFFTACLHHTLGVGGALGTASAANIFVGMVEAPLLVRPYLREMGRGALFATMTVGMATVAGTVMVLYASFLEPTLPGAAGHILVASLMSAPAGLMIARLMVPGGFADERKDVTLALDDAPDGNMEAIVRGTHDGLRLLVMVTAMLIVMVALVALVNAMLAVAGGWAGFEITLQRVVGWIAAPFAFFIGVPWNEAVAAGELIGIKIVLNELLAYLGLAAAPDDVISDRSRLILTYALSGFANFASLGIMIGGLIAMCPERRADITALGPRTILSGVLATLLTGAIAGLITF